MKMLQTLISHGQSSLNGVLNIRREQNYILSDALHILHTMKQQNQSFPQSADNDSIGNLEKWGTQKAMNICAVPFLDDMKQMKRSGFHVSSSFLQGKEVTCRQWGTNELHNGAHHFRIQEGFNPIGLQNHNSV